jgi:NO-binding membrane sensor protein with MHYT domain
MVPMARLYLCVTQQHDLSLVLLAAIVCLMASFAALSLINRAIGNEGTGRLVWLGVGATVSAAGIWATHFIAMLAFETGLPTGYDIGLTILSLLIAIVITALGFALATYRRTSSGALMGGAIVGAGISAMHFTGMAGLLVPATMAWSYGLVAAAWMSGCGFAAFALRRAVVDASMSCLPWICHFRASPRGLATLSRTGRRAPPGLNAPTHRP